MSRASVSGRLIRAVIMTVLFLASDRAAIAQTGTATINGQVTDESAAVLPGVTVTATSPALQVPQVVATTDQEGRYPLKMLDIRAEKRFNLGGTRRLSLTLNVYNVLNTNSPLGVQGRSGPQFGFVTSIPPGRLVEGAFRLGF